MANNENIYIYVQRRKFNSGETEYDLANKKNHMCYYTKRFTKQVRMSNGSTTLCMSISIRIRMTFEFDQYVFSVKRKKSYCSNVFLILLLIQETQWKVKPKIFNGSDHNILLYTKLKRNDVNIAK